MRHNYIRESTKLGFASPEINYKSERTTYTLSDRTKLSENFCIRLVSPKMFARLLSFLALLAVALAQGGKMVRQCSCAEVDQCTEDMKSAGLQCSDSCWKIANQITPRPDQLRKCFEGKIGQVDSLVDCFQDQYKG